MPDETGTETTRSDALSADESLFGDAADDTEAAVADEQDANEESAEDPQDADDVEEQAGPQEDLKVVVSIKGGRATIGVQRPSSDPHIEIFDDQNLAGLTQEARRWSKGREPGGRTNRSIRPRETRSPGQASAPQRQQGTVQDFNYRCRGRGRPTTT